MKGIIRENAFEQKKKKRVKIVQKTFPRFFFFVCLFCLNFLFQNNLNGYLGLQPLENTNFHFFLVIFFLLGGMFTANTMSSVVETLGLTLPGMQSITRSIRFQTYQDEALLGRLIGFCTLCQHFFEHFSEVKALSIIRAFQWHFPRKIKFSEKIKQEINLFQEPMPHELLLF